MIEISIGTGFTRFKIIKISLVSEPKHKRRTLMLRQGSFLI